MSPGLEEVLYQAFPVLDHGFVRVIDYMGDDAAVVQAARVSYGRGTKKVSEDKGLIHYLMRHRHSTPFEMCEIKFHVKLPIFVARQWIRHRTANVNEYSARYSILDREFYVPAEENLAAQSASNRQGRGDVLEGKEAAQVLDLLRTDATHAYDHYLDHAERERGRAEDRRVPAGPGARAGAHESRAQLLYPMVLEGGPAQPHAFPQSLRADAHAQYEIRVYADVMVDLLKRWVPLTAEAFVEHRLHGVTLSKSAWGTIKRMLAGETVTQEASGLGKREWTELQALLKE